MLSCVTVYLEVVPGVASSLLGVCTLCGLALHHFEVRDGFRRIRVMLRLNQAQPPELRPPQ